MTPTNFWIIFYLSDQLVGGFLAEDLANGLPAASLDRAKRKFVRRRFYEISAEAVEACAIKD